MDRGTRGLAMLLATQFQAIIFLGAGWYGAESLNDQYPQDFDWLLVTIPLALLLIVHSFYVVFRFVIQKEKKEKAEKNK
jgi:hypothetical protein